MASTDEPRAYLAKLEAIQLADAARFEDFQQADRERKGLIAEIMVKYTELLEDHKNLQIDFNTLQKTTRSLYRESELKDREIADMKLEQVRVQWMLASPLNFFLAVLEPLTSILTTEIIVKLMHYRTPIL